MAVGGFAVSWKNLLSTVFLFLDSSVGFCKGLLVKVLLFGDHSICHELWWKPGIS